MTTRTPGETGHGAGQGKAGALMTAIPVVEFDENGDVATLYTDEIDLYELGLIGQVARASQVAFDEANQEWMVIKPDGEVVYRDKNRERAIEWEIRNFGPGGPYHHPRLGTARIDCQEGKPS